jgi:hypothetical protein
MNRNDNSRLPVANLLGITCGCVVLSLAALSGCGCTPAAPAPPAVPPVKPASGIKFTDVTPDSGVTFTYHNGREAGVLSIVESLGGGVGIFDYDLDGLADLFFPGGGNFGPGETISGLPAGLFRQTGLLEFANVSAAAIVDQPGHFSHGCTIGDYDNDGFGDVVITGYGGLAVFHNQGDGTFAASHESAGLLDDQWSSSAGWGDLNGDGNLDLYVAHYVDWSWQNHPPCGDIRRPDVCPPRSFRGLNDIVYYSNGDGTFRDATREAGLVLEGKGLGVILADVDLDTDLDVYVANDTVDNYLYLNDGHGILTERGVVNGVAVDDRGAPNGSMGLAALDFNRDQWPDLWVSNFENETFALYRNDGSATFTHVSQSTGIHAFGSTFVGFGTAAGDLDRDGDEDLVVANGHVIYFPSSGKVAQDPLLLVNDGERFERLTFSKDNYFGQEHHGRGLALGDLDNDGDLDAAFANNNEPSSVVRNDTPPLGNWLGVRLIGTRSNRDGIGAHIVLHTTAGDQLRLVTGGGSYLSHNDSRVFFGIPAKAQVTGLTVQWPDGAKQKLEFDSGNQYLTVREY